MPETIVLVMAIVLVAMAVALTAAQQLTVIRLLGRRDGGARWDDDDRENDEGRGRPAAGERRNDGVQLWRSAPDEGERPAYLRPATALVASAADTNGFLTVRPPLTVVHEDDRQEPPAAMSPVGGVLWRGTRECTIMFVDIAGFGAARRTERDRRTIRDVTYTLVLDALDGVGAGPSVWYREDRGDGALLLLPDGVPVERLVAGAVPALLAGLRDHDRSAGPGLDLRLRVSLDAGRAAVDERGAFGDSVIAASRLLDAPHLKDRLTEPGQLLGLILSARVHEALPAKDAFERIDVHVKEHRLVGWAAMYGGGVDRRDDLPPVRLHRARRLIRAGRMVG